MTFPTPQPWGYGGWGFNGAWGYFGSSFPADGDDGLLSGQIVFALPLIGILTSPATQGKVLRMPRTPLVYEGDTGRLVLADLTHDIVGPITQNATVSYIVYRADGSEYETGYMMYSPRIGWNVSIDMPSLDEDEEIVAIVEAVAQGARRHFRVAIPVKILHPSV